MKKTLELFQKITESLIKDEEEHPVSPYIPTEKLFSSLDLSLNENPIDESAFEDSLKQLILATPKTATHAFFNQLFGGRNEKAVLGDLLAVVLNNSMYTYKAAGAQIGVEKVLLDTVCQMIGWDTRSGGTIAPGGSMTNFMAMLMARDKKDGLVKSAGVSSVMTVYTSTESHYSIPKNAAFSGIGRKQVRYIPVDKYGRMDPKALEETIAKDLRKGFQPMLVNATAGTTVMGAFDEIVPLSDICRKHEVWLHVDGAYCGSVLFSEKYKHLIEGIDRVDSFSFNAHKMIGTPLSCSLLLVKDKSHLYHSFANDADYLYQTDADEYNPGKTSLQCGRRNDALKFWTLWKSVGTKGLEKIIDQQFALANVAREYIQNHPDYTLYSYEDSISVCFNYKDISAPTLCTALYEEAELMVGFGSFGKDEFIRLVTINAQNDPEDIINFFKTLEAFVAQGKLAKIADAKV